MAGTKEKAEGIIREKAGKATGDKSLERKGKMKRAEGDAKHKIDQANKATQDFLKGDK